MAEFITVNTTDEFHEEREKHDIAIVDFHEDWCAPCITMETFLEDIVEDNPHPIIRVSPDDLQYLAQQYNVRTLPTILLLKDGYEVERFSGLEDKDTIETALESVSE